MREQVIEQILTHKVIAIVRAVPEEKILKVAKALYDGGIRFVEITFDQKDPSSSPTTAAAIAAVKREMGDKMYAGAGTVTSPKLVEMAAQAGAAYIISPDTDTDVIQRTRELGLVSIPGAYTASEAKKAHNAGADFVKLFPCIEHSDAYIKALCGPLNQIRFMAVGGVNASNAASFFRAGAVGIGVGGSLVNKKWIEAGAYELITEEAKKILTAVNRVNNS